MKLKKILSLSTVLLTTASSAFAQCIVAGTDFDTKEDLCCPILTSDSEEGGWYNEGLDINGLCNSNAFADLSSALQLSGISVLKTNSSSDISNVDDIFHLGNLSADGKPSQYGVSTITSQPKTIHPFLKANESSNNMFVNIGSAALCPILSYTVTDLKPGSKVQLTFTLHNLLDETYFKNLIESGKDVRDFITKYNYSVLNSSINGNALEFGVVSSDKDVRFNTMYNNALMLSGIETTTKSVIYGGSSTITHSAVVPETGIITFYFFRNSDCFQIPVGIDNIQIEGTIQPSIQASGSFCPQQPLILKTKKSYPSGTNLLWKEVVTGETSYKESFVFVPELPETEYNISCEVTVPGCKPSSSSFVVKSENCCMNDEGIPMAMTYIYHDDFGNFIDDETYEWTDIYGITHTETIPAEQRHASQSHSMDIKIPYARTYNIEANGAKLNVPMAGGKSPELFNHGVYVVSKFGGYPGGVKYDNSGTTTGGMLQFDLLDDGSQDEILEIDIDHLCTGKEVSSGADFASISEWPGHIEIYLEHNGNVLASADNTFGSGADGWVTARKQFTLSPSDVGGEPEISAKLKLRHIDVEDAREGRDYAIDNIFMAVCTPPDISLDAETNSGSSPFDLCVENILYLKAITTKSVENFYTYSYGMKDSNKKLGFVYQYTFDDPSKETVINKTNWHTIHAEEVLDSDWFDVDINKYWDDIFSKVEYGKNIYFRVVVGEKSDLMTDKSWMKVSAQSPCRRVSISNIPIVASLNCAVCVPVKEANIIAANEDTKIETNDSNEKSVKLNVGEVASLTTDKFVSSIEYFSDKKYVATWHKGSINAPAIYGINYKSGDVTTSLNVAYEDADTYYLLVRDMDYIDVPECDIYDSIKVIANPKVETSLTNTSVKKVSISPNPASTRTNVVAEGSVEKIEILNIAGEVVKLSNNKNIDTSKLPNGLYIVRTTIDGETSVHKLVINK